ncbi:MAG: ferritin-like domain-containing protein [Pleurocapsa minor GSE-CHR-MK-17-07R]|jgi:ferritin-like metal-binding protein YciE|nr:ferritin-like domain-containing protein [Pleurocapsa minor GSE-CHR-MK 17-07R]
MKHENLHSLLVEELKDIYDAEQQLVKALPKMAKAADSAELKAGFEEHLSATKTHVQRVEQAFKLLGEKADTKTCKAMKGLIAEGEELIGEHKQSTLLDAGLVGAAQRVEHYEIAAYGTVAAYADALGHTDVSDLLRQTLEEEKQTDALLTQIGLPINEACAAGDASTMVDMTHGRASTKRDDIGDRRHTS